MWLLTAASLAALIPTISAHGRITNITTSNGAIYQGWDPEMALTGSPLPNLAAWSAANLGNIFVPPSQFNTSNVTCHFNSKSGGIHVNTTAGDTLKLQWNEWPVSHKGPVLSYLANCNGSCANVDKNTLRWVKIDELGWINSTGSDILATTWGSDVLIANRFAWTVKVPEELAEGHYVLRHEIIALHVAEQVDGAQSYPQCINLKVEKGKGRMLSGGVAGNKLYSLRDKGILVNLHGNVTGYDIPGPKVWSYATPYEQPNQ
ncbi:lytic polysaccharide monooxygenase, partial [Periconia macrospinosa]